MYYVFIQNNKINGKGQCPAEAEGLTCLEVSEEVYNDLDHYIWDGSELIINPNYDQEHYEALCEECRQNRETAYAAEVDCITAHINRLRDEEQTPEIEQEIKDLQAERTAKVEEIKQRYPYPEEKEDADVGRNSES